MSTTTAPSTTPSPETASGAERTARARPAGPLALVTGAVLAAGGMALHLPAMPEDEALARAIADGSAQWLASHVLLGFGFALVAAGALSAVGVVRGRGARLLGAGAVLTLAGAMVMSLMDMAHGAVGFALANQVDDATSLAVQTAFFEHPVILGLNTGPLLLTVGMLLLGGGLLRSRALPRWTGAVVMAAPIAVHAVLNSPASTLIHGVPFVIGMAVFAQALVRLGPGRRLRQAG